METGLKKLIYLILIILLIVGLVILIPKLTKKKDTKTEEPKVEEKQPENPEEKQQLNDDDIDFELGEIAESIKCSLEKTEENVTSSKLYVTFNVDANKKVVTKEDVREYKFKKIDTDEVMSNKTIDVIAITLSKINGVTSTLSTIDRKAHTYRFTTIFDFRILKTDDLYEQYYKVYYTGDLEKTREDFDKLYNSLQYDDMVKPYIDEGYVCK